jgi:threonine synthase
VLIKLDGLKFTTFKTGYHEDTLSEVEAALANPPVYLPAVTRVVRQAIERRLEQAA